MKSTEINARRLEVFLKLMTSVNVSDAADKLSISQPAVSKSIRALEQECGVELFRLQGGRLTPTKAAHRLLPYVQKAIDQLEAARRAAYELNDAGKGEITIAACAPAILSIMPEAMRLFREKNERALVTILTETTPTVLQLVSTRDVDLGIGVAPMQETEARIFEKCRSFMLTESQMAVVMHRDHPLAKWSSVRPNDLEGAPIIGLPDGTPNMLHAKAAFRTAKIAPSISTTVGNSIAIFSLLSDLKSVGFVDPQQIRNGMFPELAVVPFRPRVSLRTFVYLPKHQSLNPLAEDFLSALRKAARKRD